MQPYQLPEPIARTESIHKRVIPEGLSNALHEWFTSKDSVVGNLGWSAQDVWQRDN